MGRRRLLITNGVKPRLRPHIHLRFNDLREAYCVLAPEHVYWPDDTSVAILKKLDGARDVTAIIAELAAEYDAPADMVGPDVVEFLQTWADERLIGEAA
ncbi:MAG: pyrroloquinoline quinone biosynthesis peptide chaperone PqqD [Pseudomonadota bacterium]